MAVKMYIKRLTPDRSEYWRGLKYNRPKTQLNLNFKKTRDKFLPNNNFKNKKFNTKSNSISKKTKTPNKSNGIIIFTAVIAILLFILVLRSFC